MHTLAILVSGRCNQEDQKFKDSFGYIASSKTSRTINESIPKEMFKYFSDLVKKKKNTHLRVEEAKKTRSLQFRLVKKIDNWPSTYNEIIIDMIIACRINR